MSLLESLSQHSLCSLARNEGAMRGQAGFRNCQSSDMKRALVEVKVPLGIHGFQSSWQTLPILCLLNTVNLLFIH